MTDKRTLFGREPVLWFTAVNTIVALVVGFGVDISTERQALIQAAANAILGLWARAQVTPTDQVALTKDDAEALNRERYLP